MTILQAVKSALETEATVTLVLHDEAPRTGTIKAHPTLPTGFFALVPVTGPGLFVFSTLDLVEVIFE